MLKTEMVIFKSKQDKFEGNYMFISHRYCKIPGNQN